MCDHKARETHTTPIGTPCANVVGLLPTGSRRRRLWELPHGCHCPVIGVCFPLAPLRKLVNKVMGGETLAHDYDIHVGVVSECARRNPLSELLQIELEKRYAREVDTYKSARTAQALAHLWCGSLQQGDVAGAFWAALTHPRCDGVLQETMRRDMHMLQHQVGALVRSGHAQIDALIDENAVLTRGLAKVQERSTRLLAEKSTAVEGLTARILQCKSESQAKDKLIEQLTGDMSAMRSAAQAPDAGARLQRKIEHLEARQSEVEQTCSDLRFQLAGALKALERNSGCAAPQALAPASTQPSPLTPPVTSHLHQQTVLCVGGRSGSIANYRDVVERVGARFSHHDGGQEDRQHVLDASMAAADLVICQTGCISHNAYWRVKEFCKRTGKRCVFIENPSVSSLIRGLAQVNIDASLSVAPNCSNSKLDFILPAVSI